MKVNIITAGSSSELNRKIAINIDNGWKVRGSHKVIVVHTQNRFSGTQHMDSLHQREYSITIIKKELQDAGPSFGPG